MHGLQDPVPQEFMQKWLMPILRQRCERYRKFQRILARPAEVGEVVVSVTSSGVETENRACQGDFVVRNLTAAMEDYIVSSSKFFERYTFVAEEENGWRLYQPRGEVFALEIQMVVLVLLSRTSPFEIMAPWGEPQRAELGDFLVAPPDYSEIYRIARQEFFQTYKLV